MVKKTERKIIMFKKVIQASILIAGLSVTTGCYAADEDEIVEKAPAATVTAPPPAAVVAEERERKRANLNAQIESLKEEMRGLGSSAGAHIQRSNYYGPQIKVLEAQLLALDNG